MQTTIFNANVLRLTLPRMYSFQLYHSQHEVLFLECCIILVPGSKMLYIRCNCSEIFLPEVLVYIISDTHHFVLLQDEKFPPWHILWKLRLCSLALIAKVWTFLWTATRASCQFHWEFEDIFLAFCDLLLGQTLFGQLDQGMLSTDWIAIQAILMDGEMTHLHIFTTFIIFEILLSYLCSDRFFTLVLIRSELQIGEAFFQRLMGTSSYVLMSDFSQQPMCSSWLVFF